MQKINTPKVRYVLTYFQYHIILFTLSTVVDYVLFYMYGFQWEAKVERSQDAFNKISKMIKLEMDRFEKCRIHDFKMMFIKYLENHMEHQAQVIAYSLSYLL